MFTKLFLFFIDVSQEIYDLHKNKKDNNTRYKKSNSIQDCDTTTALSGSKSDQPLRSGSTAGGEETTGASSFCLEDSSPTSRFSVESLQGQFLFVLLLLVAVVLCCVVAVAL